jgi:hypothetical protein
MLWWPNGAPALGGASSGLPGSRAVSALTPDVVGEHLRGDIDIGLYPLSDDDFGLSVRANGESQPPCSVQSPTQETVITRITITAAHDF